MSKYITATRPESFYINILGVNYKVVFCTKEEDSLLETVDGYCDNTTKEIIIQWFEDEPMNHSNMYEYTKRCIRHEIVHAMLFQCGLDSNSVKQWARNEEMVDWIAIQLHKLNKVCHEAENKYEEAISET